MCLLLLIFQQGTTYFMIASVLSMTPSVHLFMPGARIYWKELNSSKFVSEQYKTVHKILLIMY